MSDATEFSAEFFIDKIPYAHFLGARIELAGDEMTAILPFAQHLVGNPILPALHGGVLGAFMEMTAMAQLALSEKRSRLPRPIGVTVEYLRSGRPLTTYARAVVKRVGRRVANVDVEAWQESRGGAHRHPARELPPGGARQGLKSGVCNCSRELRQCATFSPAFAAMPD